MAKRRSDVPSRSEVQDRVKKHEDDMREKAEDQEEVVSDAETVQQTLEDLDLGGTAEGADEVEQSIEAAEDVTVEVFEREDEELEQIQGESQEHEQELQERSDATESDLGKVSDASGNITTQETSNELIEAKEAAIHDVEFLDEHEQQAQEARQESDRLQAEQRSRVSAKRR